MSTPKTDPPTEPVFGLRHQFQPTENSCSQTCLAMAIGAPVADVIAKFGEPAMCNQRFSRALTECHLYWNQMVHGPLVHEGWYFVTVPSLNYRGGNHRVLLHFTVKDGMTILDSSPNERYATDGSDLRGYSNLMPFWPGGGLPENTRMN